MVAETLALLGVPLALVYQVVVQHAPRDLDLRTIATSDLSWTGGDAEREMLEAALDGEEGPGGDLILYNAALRLWVYGEASGDLR